MSTPGGVRRQPRRRDSGEGGDLDRRHPFENVQRFSSPSRPHRNNSDVDDFRKLGLATGAFCMIQSLLWVAMSTAAILVYRDIIPTAEIPPVNSADLNPNPWEDFDTMLTYLYFKEGAILRMPQEGLVTQHTMYLMMSSIFIINAFWFVTSSVMFAKLRSGGPRSWVLSIRVWAFSTAVVTVMDVVLGSAMVRDLVVLQNDDPATVTTNVLSTRMSHCAALVLVVSLRAGLILVANVGLMISLLYLLSNRLNPPREQASLPSTRESPSATKREGPIDAFLFPNSSDGHMGTRNPAYVPDDVDAFYNPPQSNNWTSFKPPAEEARRAQWLPDPVGPAPALGQKRLRRITPEDMAHLSWMEEPQKHVGVELRRPMGWPSAPTEHRHALLEPEQPARLPSPELPDGQPDGHTGLGPGFGFSYLHGPGHMLPRVRVNPDAPKLPSIPPPDYSPPAARRATGKGFGPAARPDRY
ncbi:uncharacterized protein LOC113203856 [Frankliniella occidentalis]|uniref:Uncharacterized protein LOC113203856 n=1 Tax=Frankliniella occidentalis TaxID=133901 RepID=A0A6J1S5R5_FRAOC|nr:uncharacterized protein LOC113203856 [Frankliniella occidentalis]